MNSHPVPRRLGTKSSLIAKNALITPFLPLDVFRKYVKFESSLEDKDFCAGFSEGLSVIRSGIGARNVFSALEALKDTRCANVIFIGSCGGIGGARIGDIIIADGAAAAGPRSFQEQLERYFSANGMVFRTAKIYSVESVKDETESLVDNLEKGGFGGIDLETGVFLKSGAMNGLNACAALYVTDLPLKRPFTQKFTEEERKKISEARDRTVGAAVRFMLER